MKKVKLTENDLIRIIEKVVKEQEEDMGMEDMGMEDGGEAINITLDQIAMLLKDGECNCDEGQKLVLNLSGGDDEVEDEISVADYDEDLLEMKRKVRVMENRQNRKRELKRKG